jgi:hypothetical protein
MSNSFTRNAENPKKWVAGWLVPLFTTVTKNISLTTHLFLFFSYTHV